MIELKDICKSYYGQGIENKVLRHIDFKIEKGEFVMLYGESGSGKTTLLNMIGLLDPCTSGEILLNGENITNLVGDEQARLRNQTFGYVFQSFYLIPELNVMENVCLAPCRHSAAGSRTGRQEEIPAFSTVRRREAKGGHSQSAYE